MVYDNTVSVIIPVFNEEKHIENCLNSILNQSYENIIEILIMDGMSTDKTRELINKFKDERIVIVDNHKRIQSAGLNSGIKMAKGDIVVRIDAHAAYDKNYIKECVETLNTLKDENVVNVGGPTYLVTSGNYIEDCIVFLHESKFGIGVAKFRQKDYEGFVDTVWNGAFWRWIFDKVGFYNEELHRSEDNDMNNRITKSGYKIYQNKNIIAYYKPRSSVKKLLAQNYSNGKAIGNSIVNNREIIRIRHLVPLIFMLTIVCFGVLLNFSYLSKIIEIIALGSYFTIDFIECLRIASQKGIKYVPLLFILFFTLHICYGFGTLIGFFQQLFRKNKV
ncbi:glycosyltransferase family 2 protein [Clostridium sp. DJ247]|uniref:glycosyltransferase family 2 protein n=1 Tax=Clostridium sp. DJ247 TaxID=2726188 RepID=UPI0016250535|nr:glycosyltransferase family 2 protein [Clostridium sp. DJ247]MBC2580249.1 glycosyltransferase family 2 protein [Clostridium sp. DJ247]